MLPIFVLVLMSEMVVDWIKHAFITKFNDISPDVYRKYRAILSKDLVTSRHGNVRNKINDKLLSCCYLGMLSIQAKADHCDLVSRRMGFIPLPLGCLVSTKYAYYNLTHHMINILFL